MTVQEIKDLYIRSFDEPMSTEQKDQLLNAMRTNAGLATEFSYYKRTREALLRTTPASFGPYFAIKVVAKIQNVGIQIDRQIFAFFKKFQLAAVGVVIALLALNVIFADEFNLKSFLGLESSTNTTEEIVSFDFYEMLNDDL